MDRAARHLALRIPFRAPHNSPVTPFRPPWLRLRNARPPARAATTVALPLARRRRPPARAIAPSAARRAALLRLALGRAFQSAACLD